jgi:carbon monoxide dehydrogenase subunit G
MQITREVLLPVSADVLWSFLWDVPRVVACLPGCVDAAEVEPQRRYRARMQQRVGPISIDVPLDVEILEADPPRRLVLKASGRDRLVGAEIAMRVTLACAPATAGSMLRIDADGRVLGKLGALGHGVIQRKAEEAVAEFAARAARAVAPA